MKTKESYAATSVGHRIIYALGDVGSNFIWTFTSGFLTLYYTDSVGISAAFVGTMMLICRAFDGISDISMGIVIDKTKTRWGKARPWLLFGAVPLGLSLMLVFNVPSSLGKWGQSAYVFATYFFMTVICYTVVNLSFHAMLPLFSLTLQDRNGVQATRTFMVAVLNLFLSFATTRMLNAFGGQKEQHAWTMVSAIYAVLGVVCILVCFWGTKEKVSGSSVPQEERKEKTVGTAGSVKILLHNKYFYVAAFIILLQYVISGLRGVSIYYCREILGNSNFYGLLTLTTVIPVLLGTLTVPALMKRFGKKQLVQAGLLLQILCLVIQMLSPRNVLLVFVLSLFKGFGMVPTQVALFTLAGDIVDYTQWKNGIRVEGFVTSVNSFGIKVGTGLGSAMLGWILAFGGYDGTLTAQSGSALKAIIVIATVAPAICCAAEVFLWKLWDIDKYRPEIERSLKKE